jgi:hypothetical protein
MLPIELDDRSPLARWLGLPLTDYSSDVKCVETCTSTAHDVVNTVAPMDPLFFPREVCTTYIAAQPEGLFCFIPMQCAVGPQEYANTDGATASLGDGGLCQAGQLCIPEGSHSDTTSTDLGDRLSKSAARRLRRQKASAYRAEELAGREAMTSCPRNSTARVESVSSHYGSANARGSMLRLSLHPEGCRRVQAAIENAKQSDAAELVAELRGCVWKAITSPHGNHVIQKMIEVLPPSLVAFVGEELRGLSAETSRHKFGCRVMCRLLEHSPTEPSTIALVDEALKDARDLCSHTFGHHVFQSILVHGLPRQRQHIAATLSAELQNSPCQRNLFYVLQTALENCSAQQHADLALVILGSPAILLSLTKDKVGCHVLTTLLLPSGQDANMARQFLQQEHCQLQSSDCGRQLLAELRLTGAKAEA